MADALDPGKVAEIRRLAADGLGRNEVARRVGCSISTVTRYSPPGSFDRAATAAAVKARQLDLAARRAALAANLLADAERLREQLWQPGVVFAFGGKDNDYNEHHVEEPPAADKRTLMQAATAAMTAHLKLVDHDTDAGVDEARDVAKLIAAGLARLFPDTPA